MDKKILFAAAAALQIVALFVIAARYEIVDRYGTEILVPAYGYDPRDLFRGDYVNLTYWPVSTWTGTLDFEPESGEKLFVVPEISSTGTFVSIRSVAQEAPDTGLFIRATASSHDFWKPVYGYRSPLTSSAVPVSWTFENEFEYPYHDAKNPDSPVTKFRLWSTAIAAMSESGSLIGLYEDANECASGLESHLWSAKAVAMPATDAWAYEARAKEFREKCKGFPRVEITSVAVPKILSLGYSTDRFFVEEDTGRPIEASIAKWGVLAVWRVSSSWKTVLHGLKVGDTLIK